MQLKMYSIYDEVTQVFNHPFAAIAEQEAVRNMRILVNDPSTLISKSPQDYTLYHVAMYDDQTGQYTNTNQPVMLCKATSLIQNKPIPTGE